MTRATKKTYLPCLATAFPVYATVPIQLLEACHAAVAASRDLSRAVPGKSPAFVRAAVLESRSAEVLLAEQLRKSGDEALAEPSAAGLPDFALATLAQVHWEQGMRLQEEETVNRHLDRHAALLTRALLSPDLSVLLDYDRLHLEMAMSPWLGDAADPIDLLERGLAHTLHHSGGASATELLLDMAAVHMADCAWYRGIDIYACLVLYDPHDFDVYDALAWDLAAQGELALACQVVQRGLETAAMHRSRTRRAMLADALRCWQRREGPRQGAVPRELEEKLADALSMALPCGWTLDELVARLVPHLDEVPLKRLPRSL